MNPTQPPTLTARDTTAPWEFNLVEFLVADLEMSIEGVPAAKQLLLWTNSASQLLLARVVNRIFVSCEVIWARELRPTDLVGAWIDAIADVRSMLVLLILAPVSPSRYTSCAMAFPLVVL